MKGRLVTALVAVTVVASVWYVQALPRTTGDYRERAALTVDSLRSQVQSARLCVQESEDGGVTNQIALVGLREAEEDASEAASEFAGWDPQAAIGKSGPT